MEVPPLVVELPVVAPHDVRVAHRDRRLAHVGAEGLREAAAEAVRGVVVGLLSSQKIKNRTVVW